MSDNTFECPSSEVDLLRLMSAQDMYEYIINKQNPQPIISFIVNDEHLARKYWMGRFSYNNNHLNTSDSKKIKNPNSDFRLTNPEFDTTEIFNDYVIVNKNRVSTYR